MDKKNSTRIWLMRHAEVIRPEVFHGYESDTDLGEYGYRQVQAITPIITQLQPDAVVSSGMLRARKTAEPLARSLGFPLRIEPSLHERKVGDMVGTPAMPDQGIWPETLQKWMHGELDYAPPGMESFLDIQQRVMPVWDRLAEEFLGRSLVIVAHGIVCRVILLTILKNYRIADWPQLGRIANVSISEVVGTARDWQAVRIGELPEVVRNLPR